MAQALKTPEAELDLMEIWLFIARDSIEAADRVAEKIDAECRSLAETPGIGIRRGELAPRLQSFPVDSYVIFYRRAEEDIEILRVLHGARRITSSMF